MLGPTRIVDRNNIYEDVIDMYSEGEIVGEYPLVIKYKGEQAKQLIKEECKGICFQLSGLKFIVSCLRVVRHLHHSFNQASI